MELKQGTLLQNGKYRIEKVLGQGSFGITYLATMKTKVGGNLGNMEATVKVAIKEFFMRDINERSGIEVSTGSNMDIYHKYRKDFIREASKLSRLKHPHIVKVMELFEANNTAYFSMEYIDGGSLNDYIQSNDGMSERDALQGVSHIIDALSCMHANNMLHLDLKPLNIMRRNNGDLVLIDFGLSKQFNSDGEPESLSAGTMGYAPLEQYNYKKSDGFCPTLDIYALGATLYKMLTGLTPPDALVIFNDGFPEDEMKKRNINKDIISLISWAMEPIKRKRPQTVEILLKEIKRIHPYASDIHKKQFNKTYVSHNEPTNPIFEECNEFEVRWNRDVYISEFMKNKIRDLLRSMSKIGEKVQFIYTEYGKEKVSTVPVMSLGDSSWRYLYPLVVGEDTNGYFPPLTISIALQAIWKLSLWTGLPFRLSDETEIIYAQSAVPFYWESLRTLCYSRNKRLQFMTYGTRKGINDVVSFDCNDDNTYDIQLVCDGYQPAYNKCVFNVPNTQDLMDEILPIGFGLYKVRVGALWNVRSNLSPLSLYLPVNYDEISYINIWHVPGGGPKSGYDFFGIMTKLGSSTSYYSFENGNFRLLVTLSFEEMEERKTFT